MLGGLDIAFASLTAIDDVICSGFYMNWPIVVGRDSSPDYYVYVTGALSCLVSPGMHVSVNILYFK